MTYKVGGIFELVLHSPHTWSYYVYLRNLNTQGHFTVDWISINVDEGKVCTFTTGVMTTKELQATDYTKSLMSKEKFDMIHHLYSTDG